VGFILREIIIYKNFIELTGKIKLENAKFSAVKDVKLNQRLKKVYYSLQDIYQ
jgi:hypothetical protein